MNDAGIRSFISCIASDLLGNFLNFLQSPKCKTISLNWDGGTDKFSISTEAVTLRTPHWEDGKEIFLGFPKMIFEDDEPKDSVTAIMVRSILGMSFSEEIRKILLDN